MTTERLVCSRCGSSMEEGVLTDAAGSATYQSTWMSGHPESTFWLALNLEGKAVYPVVTYRCTRCGYLESYARSEKQ